MIYYYIQTLFLLILEIFIVRLGLKDVPKRDAIFECILLYGFDLSSSCEIPGLGT